MLSVMCFFFFKQKTAYEMRISDWSSDVCSSDLLVERRAVENFAAHHHRIDRPRRSDILERVFRQQHQIGRHSRLDRAITIEPAEPCRPAPRLRSEPLHRGPPLFSDTAAPAVHPGDAHGVKGSGRPVWTHP